jgi:hypothetical protein
MYVNLRFGDLVRSPSSGLPFLKKILQDASLKTTYHVPKTYYVKFPYVRPGLAKFNLTAGPQNSLRNRPGLALLQTYIEGVGD